MLLTLQWDGAPNPSKLSLPYQVQDSDRRLLLAIQMAQELDIDGDRVSTRAWRGLVELVLYLYGRAGEKEGALPRDPVDRALALLHRHYAAALRLEDYAKVIGLSAKHLNRLFRSRIGCTIPAYLRDLRLRKAGVLLLQPMATLDNVAVEVGLSSGNYLGKLLRRSQLSRHFSSRRQGEESS